MNKSRSGFAAALISNVIFGFGFLGARVMLDHTTTFMMLSSRFTVALLVMSLLALLRVFPLNLKKKGFGKLMLLALCQPTAYFICESYGIDLTTTSFSGAFLAVVPLGSLLLAVLFLKERVTRGQLFWSSVCVAGVILLSVSNVGQGIGSPLGIPFLVGAILTTALYNVMSRKLSTQFTAFERTYGMLLLGTVAFTTLAVVECRGAYIKTLAPLLTKPSFVLALLYLAICSSCFGVLLQNYALGKLPVGKAAIFNSIMTVVTVLAGVFILKEPFGWIQAVGSALILCGIYRVATIKMVEKAPE